ncbi:Hypothetical protein LUCI_2269 [Lucifera butyrica]|uniref:VTT domain-containing protein n=1 Tax=Lucifera butyrica TaxID=1351585 RepID=A0A498R7S7_9FIRM|nr:DedA family protein [Lucifera butyrica]VBB07025.1 Hypothetical protein LUCI_2269 [Lucifera butyrica]
MDYIVQTMIDYIGSQGYFAILVGTGLASMGVPVPSELTLAFAGYLVFAERLQFGWVIPAALLGEVLGSLIAYLIGYFGEGAFVHKYGKYMFLSPRKLEYAQAWFERYGMITVLVGRILPVVRGMIALPAGLLQVNLKKFMIYIVLSSTIWCIGLVSLGRLLGENWRKLYEMGHAAGLVAVFGLLLFLTVGFWVRKKQA